MAILATLTLVVGSFVIAGPAQASDTTLCVGTSFSACNIGSYTTHGYENHYTSSYWNAYAGHNCTNYVGYMLAQNGDPGHGVDMGNATGWDNTISKPANAWWGYSINTTPAVGAIAQWEGNDSDSINYPGHVAYVESVNSDGSITVSEDNVYPYGLYKPDGSPYSPNFRWRTIPATGGNWPTRFLHIKDMNGRIALVNDQGDFWAKDGATSGSWTAQDVIAADIAISSTGRTVIVNDNAELWYKDFLAAGAWTTMSTGGAVKIAIGGNRIAMIDTLGDLWVKEGISAGSWTKQNVKARDVAISSSGRIVMVNDQNWVWYKDALAPGAWTNLNVGAVKIAAGGNRIALINDQGQFYAKDGVSSGSWTAQSVVATEISITSSGRLVMINDQGWLWAKDALAAGAWMNLDKGAVQVAVG